MLADRLPVAAAALRERRRGALLWALAVGAVSAMYVAFWPAMGEGAEMQALIDNMPEALVVAMGYEGIGSPAGYLESTVFGLLAPILLLVLAITAGARLVGGEEEDGTLELELTAPASRLRIYVERLAAAWLLVGALVVATTVAVLASGPLFDLGIRPLYVLAASLGLLLLVGGFTTLAFAIGAGGARRSAAIGAAAGLAVLAYVFRGVANAAGVELLGALSPFAWMLDPEPLVHGFAARGLALLAGISLIAAPLGAWAFMRRDLMT